VANSYGRTVPKHLEHIFLKLGVEAWKSLSWAARDPVRWSFPDPSSIYVPQKFAKRYSKAGRDGQQSLEGRHTMPSFYQANGRAVKPTMVCEGFLAQATPRPQLSHPLSQCQQNMLHRRQCGSSLLLRLQTDCWQTICYLSENDVPMIHVIRHLIRSAHHGIKHSSVIANSVFAPASRATPRAWTAAGKAHRHTSSFWTKVAQRGFRFWS
jgi:hypothetical protein